MTFQTSLIDKIKQLSDKLYPDMIQFCQKLLQTPSLSGDEKALADLNLDEMRKLGYDEVFRDKFGNVIGIVRGTEEGPSILYNSHMDHVEPGDPENWEGYNPYGGQRDICAVDNIHKELEQAECLHGRGASDVKGGEAVQIYTGGILAQLKKEGYPLKGTFIFSGVVQEEPAEMIGTIHLLDETFPEKGLTYDAMVTSEATSLKLYTGHRGRAEMLVTITGRTSHGSAPWLGINAIYKAVPFISKIKDEYAKRLPKSDLLGDASVSINIIECSPGAMSIVPDKCMLSVDRRLVPGETYEDALHEMEEILNEIRQEDPDFKAEVCFKKATEVSYTGVTYEGTKCMAAWNIERDNEYLLKAADALTAMGQTVEYGVWDFGTDASKTAGIDGKPTFGYSPMQEQYAHTPYDKVRTDYMKTALEGNIAIYLNCTE